MTAALEKPQKPKQIFVQTGISWKQFKIIQQSFENIPNVRLNYCEGELEILGISKPHEAMRCILAALLATYFVEHDIEFFPSGSYSQIVEGITEYQADLSYCLGTDKDVSDLSIEIVISSGGTKKLQKYRRKGVKEVWFWKKGKFSLYSLQSEGYSAIDRSELLPELDIALLSRCMIMDSKLEAVKTFRQAIQASI